MLQNSMEFGSLALFLYTLAMFLTEVTPSHCDHVLYDPVSDCSSHALRIGYYPSPNCGRLHSLTDSDGQPNADFARLNDPASYDGSSGTQYHEYAAGSYLSIKLFKQAEVHGVAIQGSPNELRYYLRSFQISYKTTIANLTISQPSTTSIEFYKESGVIKQFTGEMRSVKKFVFANPFYAEEIRIHPLVAHGNRVFRAELYGCYLGRINGPSMVGMNYPITFTTTRGQRESSSNNQFYVKIQEPNGANTFVQINGSLNYTFTSSGLANVYLGVRYTSGWLHVDEITKLLIQGPVLGLQMKLDGNLVNPYKKTENQDIEFRLEVSTQVFQMKQVSFQFGDSTTCAYNYCRKRYTRGVYFAKGTATNNFYQASLEAHVVACPSSPVSVTYIPTIYGGGIPISYKGASASHSFTVQFYALWITTYEVRINGVLKQTGTVNATGLTTREITLPTESVAPSQLNVVFNYTDFCETRSYTVNVFLDEEIKGLSFRLNQTFKEELISPVSYYFKDKPFDIYLDLTNGTTVQCIVTLHDLSASSFPMSPFVADKVFSKTHTFTSPGDTFPTMSASCTNRLNLPPVILSATAFDFREIPEPMANFSLALSKSVVATGEGFNLYIIFSTGTGMNCSVNSSTAGVLMNFAYSDLTSRQIVYSSTEKAYRVYLSTSSYSTSHVIQVSCYTAIKKFTAQVSFQALIIVSGTSIVTSSFVCFGTNMVVQSLLAQGRPVQKELLIDSVTNDTYQSLSEKDNTFSVGDSIYKSPGWKNVAVRVWNGVTASQVDSKVIRIAKTPTNVEIETNFTLSSSQGLPDRPYLVLPTNELILFKAIVTPQDHGYIYNWHFGALPVTTQVPTHSRTFPSKGTVQFKLVVDGCTNLEFNRNLTILSPISDFTLATIPNPEVVVNKTTTVRIGFAAEAECLKLDFGDGTSLIKNCKNNTAPHPLSCFTSGTFCTVNHVYKIKGVYTITVTASNELFENTKTISVTAKTCYNPKVTLEGSGSDISDFVNNLTESISATNLHRSSPFFYNITSVAVDCEFTSSYSQSWKVYSAAVGSNPGLIWNDPSFLMSNSLFTFGNSLHSLLVPCCFLPYGTFTVTVDVGLTGHSLVNDFKTTKAFLVNITHTDLVPVLDRPKYRVYGFNTMVILNGSQSYDPDKYSDSLLFTWYCRDTSLEPRDLSAISSFPFLDHTDTSLAQPVSGCFGQPFGVINITKSADILEFNSKLVQENHTIEITMVIGNTTSLGARKSSQSTSFLVLTKETPYFEIRCSENCGTKMNPWLRLSLLVDCYGDACLQKPRWNWILVMHNATSNVTLQLDSKLHSLETDKDLRMKPAALLPGTSYALVLKGTGQGGAYYEQEFKFVTNEAPGNGTCSISPSSFVPKFQELTFICTNWIDADLPLSYEVALVNSISATVLCSSPSCKLFIPRDFADNSTLVFRTRIYDSRWMYTELHNDVHSLSCEEEIYSSVANCANNPLRVGYYNRCGELHSLYDSGGKPNANYARLQHPALVGSQILEYSASEYLLVKLSKAARVSAIALQGSPNGIRYYLKGFELWYKTVIEKVDIAEPSTVLETYYEEGGTKKTFSGSFGNVTTIGLANPFISEELRIYPTDYHIDKVFRVELYGCYLGRLIVPPSFVVNVSSEIRIKTSQDSNVTETQYYLKITEPNKTSVILNISNTTQYTFRSYGVASIVLGLKHSSGWVSVDHEDVIVQGPVLGLGMLVDGYSLSPYKRTTFKDVKFNLFINSPSHQVTSVLFDFGNSTNCTYNNCQKSLTPGLYHVKGTASNAAFQQSVYKHVISCPLTDMGASYRPLVHQGGVGLKYTGPTSVYSFIIRHFALWTTNFHSYFGSLLSHNGTINGTGWMSTTINYTAQNLAAPFTESFDFNYTDECGSWSQKTAFYVDEEIIDLAMQVNQTFKQQLIVQVPYLLKNQSVDFLFAMKNGTSVQCFISINESSSYFGSNSSINVISNSITVTNKQFAITHTFTSPGDSVIYLEAKCWNRLKLPDVRYTTTLEVQKIPEIIKNFSVDVSKWTVKSSEIFHIYLYFETGERMTCNITSNSTGITSSYSYKELLANEVSSSDTRKSYRLPFAADSALPTLLINIVCQNILNEAHGNVSLDILPVPIEGLKVNVMNFACYGTNIPVSRNVTKGSPIYDTIIINNNTVLHQLNYIANQTHYIGPDLYGLAGTKYLTIRSSNSLNFQQSETFKLRIALPVTTLDVAMNFTLSSPQGLSVRPCLILPLSETVNFTALVTPLANGYLYQWQINEIKLQTNASFWSFSFPSIGIYRFRLEVGGCNSLILERNLTVISAISSFNVTTNPTPNCVVNESTIISITHGQHSECIELDFGDGSREVTSCKSNITTSELSCFDLGSVCNVQHVYRQRGTYTIKVRMFNSLFAKTVERTLVARTCYDPKFTLQGIGTEIPGGFSGLDANLPLVQAQRSVPLIYNITSVITECEFSNAYSIRWAIYSLGINSSTNQTSLQTEGQTFAISNSTVAFKNGNHLLHIPCCLLNYGEVVISVEVTMEEHYLIGGFSIAKVMKIFVNDTDLVPDFVENSYKSYPYNTEVTVNASLSYDPDGFSTDLNYTWYCRDVSLEQRDVLSISNLPRIHSEYFFSLQNKSHANNTLTPSVSPTPSIALQSILASPHSIMSSNNSIGNQTTNSNVMKMIGCFGKAAGILDIPNTTKEISFNSRHLHGNHTIEFTVVVEARTPFRLRRSSKKKSIIITLPLTPYFELRCKENCKSKVDPSHKFFLKAICKGGACDSNATFKWTMEQYNETSRKPIQLHDVLYSTDSSKNFFMKPNVLTPGQNYSIVLRATAPDGSYFQQQYLLSANIPPLNGSCVVNPKRGLAIFTPFEITCTGWIDTERPITYEVAHINKVLTTVVCRQHNSTCRTILPIGPNGDMSLVLRVRIIDSLGMFTEIDLSVHMDIPTLTVLQLDYFLAKIENATRGQKIAQFIGAMASVLDYNAEENRTYEQLQKKIQIRDTAMSLLLNMVNTSSDDVIAPLIAKLAEVPSELLKETATKAVDAIGKMTTKLTSDHTNVLFRDLVSRGKSLIAAKGMVMMSTSINLDPNLRAKNESNFTENPLKWSVEEGKSLVLTTLAYSNSMTDTILGRMSPVEEAVEILTSNLGIVLKKEAGSTMNHTTANGILNASIVLPQLDALNLDNNLIVNSVLKYTTFNTYFWHWQSNLIKSSLVDFQLKSDLSHLQVRNTKEPIQLSIPRQIKRPFVYEHWTFQDRYMEERRNFHRIKIEHDNSLHVEFKPMNYCLDFQVYIGFEQRPSRDDYLRNWTLPSLSGCGSSEMQDNIRANICSVYQEIAGQALNNWENEFEPYLNCTYRQLLDARIDEIIKPCALDPYRMFLLDKETKNGTYFIGIFEKNGTVSGNSSAAQLLNDTTKCQIADVVNETSYFIRSFTSKCRFWDSSGEGSWESYGCQVGPKSNATVIECKCNHLTSFASDFLIAPNPIDMDRVIEGFKNIHDNVSVVVLISLLLGLYALLVVRVRKTDKLDSQKVGVVAVQHTHSDNYQYLVITVTGARINAGTTANVFCSLNSGDKKGEARILLDLEKTAFQRDQINAFKIGYKESVGDLTDIRIWHDNEGESPGWYLSRVYVEDLQTNKAYTFICEQWLAVELEEGLIDRSIGIADQDDHRVFSHIFTTKTAKDFSDQHLWLSVLLKRPHDTFTRVQRITCCLAMLCLTMLASAMFFQLGNNSKYLWKIGSLVIDYKGIIIGIQSAFVVIPVSSILVAIFKNAESLQMYKARRRAKKLTGEKSKRRKCLPFGFLIIAWFLAVVTILGCVVIVLFYSMQWGNEKSTQFVVSILTGFFQSAFVFQPLKLILFAVLIAAIFKRNQDESNTLEMYKFSSNIQTIDLSKGDVIGIPNLEPRSLTQEELKYARKKRRMEVRLRIFLQDFISYVIFLMFLAFVARGYRDTDGYYFSKALTDDIVHQHFEHIKDVPGLWSWVQNHFIPAIYTQEWYNGDNFSDFKMTNNQEAYRIGLARIRQVRVRKNTCTLPNDVKGIVHMCNAPYSFNANEEGDFDVGWGNLSAIGSSLRRKRSVAVEDKENALNVDDLLHKPYLLGTVGEILPGVPPLWDHKSMADNRHEKTLGLEAEYRSRDDKDEGRDRKRSDAHESISVDDTFVFEDNTAFEVDALENTKRFSSLSQKDFVHVEPMNQHTADYESDTATEKTLVRKRRALKFKINRKTIPSTSSISHPNEINIDSQYLLPNGKLKPNKQHWLYHDMSELRGFPYTGHTATYSGGGYVASLATDIDYARATAMALEQDTWIDSFTRAVFFEFSVYNANLNLFATGFVIAEVLPIGNVLPSSSVKVFKLYRYVGTFGRLVMVSEIMLVLCLIFFIYKECRLWYRIGRDYLKQFWSWVEITIAIALFAALILRAFSWYEADKNLILFRKDPEKFISFNYTVVADEALLVSITVICFAATLKMLKILAFFPTIVVLQKTLRLCLNPLINYALPFFVAFCGFCALGHLLFHETTLFSSYVTTAETQLLMLIGGSVFSILQEANVVLGPVFFVLFAAFETCIMLNIFLSIINEGITHSADWNKETRGDEFVEYVEQRASAMLNAFSLSLKETAAVINLGSRRPTRLIEVGETVEDEKEKFLKEDLSCEILSQMPSKRNDIMNNHDLILRRLENKICENFEMEKDDAKYMLNFIVAIKSHKKVPKTNKHPRMLKV